MGAVVTRVDADLSALHRLYPSLEQVSPAVETCIENGDARWLHCEAGQLLFQQGDACPGFPLAVTGKVRVARHSEDGRELELYKLEPGEVCLTSCAGLFQKAPVAGFARTRAPTQLFLVKSTVFEQWMEDKAFRQFVMGLFAQRLVDLSGLIDGLAFKRLDARLASALLGHGTVLHTTHQALADDVGTVREMVSRILARFEREGWIRVSRENIEILNSSALRLHAG